MNKVFLVIKREYLARVRKKSFLLATLITPLVFPAILGIFLWISLSDEGGEALKIIEVVDDSGRFFLESNGQYAFSYSKLPVDEAKAMVQEGKRYGFLYIPQVDIKNPKGIVYYSEKNPSMGLVSHLERELKRKIEEIRLFDTGIDPKVISEVRTNVSIQSVTLEESGEEKLSNAGVNYGLGFFLGILIYTFIFVYGTQIMQGVIEEKSSRIIEILVSSIKPFQLMLGKIIGIGAVGLTQFLIWIVLISTISTVVMGYFGMQMPQQQALEMANPEAAQTLANSSDIAQIMQVIQGIDFVQLVLTFLFYFLGGYLLYGAFFAAIGAAVDSPSDAQQFMFPVTIPLIASYFALFVFILDDPNSNISFWLSVIPFTAPIAMVGRASFGIPAFDLVISMVALIAGFLFTTWVAAKIYRIGILVHGTKVSYKTLWKWIKQSN
ncbi:ABC transporter permease [Echinicola sp. CAU 1574]|uniref:ABC transporter permease n=1 Tax=Echinicola arenosa TaxID=2774144 RepID=A0ABR9AHG6_9BACT|nr:ABC transporter permease [Echinicola arenosa]MBD8488295.1 ABC transporter permease [Echinicola arenosa]